MADRWHRLREHSAACPLRTLTSAAYSSSRVRRSPAPCSGDFGSSTPTRGRRRPWPRRSTPRAIGRASAGSALGRRACTAPSSRLGEEFPSQILIWEVKTVRQIVRGSIGGDRVRIRLANTFGDAPLVVGAAHSLCAMATSESIPAPDRTADLLRFTERSRIPPGSHCAQRSDSARRATPGRAGGQPLLPGAQRPPQPSTASPSRRITCPITATSPPRRRCRLKRRCSPGYS